MLIRLWTIIALLLQPLALLPALGQTHGAVRSDTCCQITVKMSCCGEKQVIRHGCSMPGGQCMCKGLPDQKPPAPWVPTSRDHLPLVILSTQHESAVADQWVQPVSGQPDQVGLMASTPSQARALLCIWRT